VNVFMNGLARAGEAEAAGEEQGAASDVKTTGGDGEGTWA